jgi:hypothetical protein
MVPSNQLTSAIETFVRGFCAVKSRTHPYEYGQIDGIWFMRDAQRKNPRDYRKEEWIGCGIPAKKLDAVARKHTRGRHFLCDIVPGDEVSDERKLEFKQLGYRLLAREGFFEHPLERIPRAKSPAKIVQVRTPELATRFGKATRMRPMTDAELSSTAPSRQYVALVDDKIVGWVRSVDAGRSNWCTNFVVIPSYRRRGIGTALLITMLRDDRKLGVASNVLTSSSTGALVYPIVGYQQIGILYIFAPHR